LVCVAFVSFYDYVHPLDLHSFPTRRSSDLRNSLPYQRFCAVIFRKYSDQVRRAQIDFLRLCGTEVITVAFALLLVMLRKGLQRLDRKSTRLNSSHVSISYAVFCLKKKMNNH